MVPYIVAILLVVSATWWFIQSQYKSSESPRLGTSTGTSPKSGVMAAPAAAAGVATEEKGDIGVNTGDTESNVGPLEHIILPELRARVMWYDTTLVARIGDNRLAPGLQDPSGRFGFVSKKVSEWRPPVAVAPKWLDELRFNMQNEWHEKHPGWYNSKKAMADKNKYADDTNEPDQHGIPGFPLLPPGQAETEQVFLFGMDLMPLFTEDDCYPVYAAAGQATSPGVVPPLMQAVKQGNDKLLVCNRDDSFDVSRVLRHLFSSEYILDMEFSLKPQGPDDERLAATPVAAFPLSAMQKAVLGVPWERPHEGLEVWHRPGGTDLGVGSDTLREARRVLTELADRTRDRFMPQYQNIIDPNLLVAPPGCGALHSQMWMASDLVVQEDGTVMVDGFLHDFDRNQHEALYAVSERVLSAAVPALAQLRKPALLLPGKLQVTTKAQRIIVRPGDNYDGVWHKEQKLEHVAAVIVYYTNVSDNITGGDLEVCSRRAHTIVDPTDDGPLGAAGARGVLKDNRARIPVRSGQLLVFSNYDNVHRVLRMRSTDDQPGVREFLMFFVIDQRQPLVPLNLSMRLSTALQQTLSEGCGSTHFPRDVLDIILQYGDLTRSTEDKQALRKALMREALQPSGRFGANNERAYTTGNGCPMLVGWLDGEAADGEDASM